MIKLTYEGVYTPSLGSGGPHPYWHYERGYWLDCDCIDCRQLRADDPEVVREHLRRRNQMQSELIKEG